LVYRIAHALIGHKTLHAGELKAMERGRFEMAAFMNSEHFVGTGYLYNGTRQICRTRYHVDTYLEPSEDIENIIGKPYLLDQLKEIRGKIKPIELSLDSLFGSDWTLVLEDGRRLDFFITETITGTITPMTGFRS
jgi:hypothetical protein